MTDLDLMAQTYRTERARLGDPCSLSDEVVAEHMRDLSITRAPKGPAEVAALAALAEQAPDKCARCGGVEGMHTLRSCTRPAQAPIILDAGPMPALPPRQPLDVIVVRGPLQAPACSTCGGGRRVLVWANGEPQHEEPCGDCGTGRGGA